MAEKPSASVDHDSESDADKTGFQNVSSPSQATNVQQNKDGFPLVPQPSPAALELETMAQSACAVASFDALLSALLIVSM